MKKLVIIMMMLSLTLAAFAQNTIKVVILDTYNKGGKVSQVTLCDIKERLTQSLSEMYGFEGVNSQMVDAYLLSEGYKEHPRLSEVQVKMVANLAETPYAIKSEASVDELNYLTVRTVLINLDEYQVMASESASMNNTADQIYYGCEQLVQKITAYLPKPEMPIVEEKPITVEQVFPTEPLPAPQQLTSLEAEKVSRFLNRADVCIEMNYIDEAIKQYDEIVKIAPGWANVYMYLGNTYSLKGDVASLQKAKENYNKFVQLTDDKDLYYEAQDKLSRIEMMTELKGKEDENVENLVGTWKTGLHNKYTGQPFFVFDIMKTSIPNRLQIVVSPKGVIHNNLVNTKAYADIVDGEIAFSYTFQETYIPSQSSYNAAGAAVNYLFGNSLLGTVGGTLVEMAREGDVGYTNIMDFEFNADVNVQRVQDELYQVYGNEYMDGSCHMKGEHHQAGRSIVNLDTIYGGGFYKGDENYPVFIKVTESGGNYYYGDVRDGIKLSNNNPITNYSPYISKEESRNEYKKYKNATIVSGVFLGVSGGFLLSGLLFNSIMKSADLSFSFGKTFFAVNGVVAGASVIGLIASGAHWNNYLNQCYTIHNRHVDENIRRIGQSDQASVTVNVGVTPMRLGVSLNF